MTSTKAQAVQKVAIAGSGVAALAAAISLAEAGVEVDVFEKKHELTALGSGITLQGNSLRAFDQLGVWPRVREKGFAFDGLNLRAPGPGALIVAELPDVKTGGPDYPSCLGMYRPDLATILIERAVEVGARIHFDAELTAFEQDDAGVDVYIHGELRGRYDLLIGADGLHSKVRELLGIDTVPQPTGMGIWRAFVERAQGVERSELYYGGPVYIAGYTPTGENSMYAILVEQAQDRSKLSEAEATEIMITESAAYDGPWNSIRTSLAAGNARVNYTHFTSHIVEEPWNRNRVVIIGDAAHSCPPTIAQGAAQALEDALVLSELLTHRPVLDQQLWDDFHARRLPRARAVVEASVQLGQWQIDGNTEADPGALINGVAQKMAEPA